MGRPLKVVYLTYDGLEDPLGQSQVRPYINGLSRRGHRFEIVSFEKPGTPTRWREPISEGVTWTALRYHRTPTVPATTYDMIRGAAVSAWLALARGADLIHARSYVPAVFALPSLLVSRIPLLFDTRGLWADEKVDGGAWPPGDWKFEAAKRVERILLRRARAIAVLTCDAQRHFRTDYPFASEIQAPIHVIPCAADLARFTPDVPPDPALAPRLGGARVLGYVGSLGTWYMGDTMSRFYLAWRRAVREAAGDVQTRFLVITRSNVGEMEHVLKTEGAADELVVHSAANAAVPSAIRWAEAALAFRKPTVSSRAGSPVKIGEQLACGVPVVANVFGDIAELFEGSRVAVLLRDFSQDALQQAACEIVAVAVQPGVREEARALAARWFDLDRAVEAYEELYEAATRSDIGGLDVGWPRTPR